MQPKRPSPSSLLAHALAPRESALDASPEQPDDPMARCETPAIAGSASERAALDSICADRADAPEAAFATPASAELVEVAGVGVEIRRDEVGAVVARFGLRLASVATCAPQPGHLLWNEAGAIAAGEASRQRAFASLACSLRPSQRVRFVHDAYALEDGELRYRLLIEGEVRTVRVETAIALARELLDSLRVCLSVGADLFGFEPLACPVAPAAWFDEVELVPAAIAIEPSAPAAFGVATPVRESAAMLPIVPKHRQTYLDGIIAALLPMGAPTQLVVQWQGLTLDSARRDTLARAVSSLLDRDPRSIRYANGVDLGVQASTGDVQLTHRALGDWIAHPLGARMRVWVRSQSRLPPSVAQVIGREVFLDRPFGQRRSLCDGFGADSTACPLVDLRGLVASQLPIAPLLPEPLGAAARGLQPRYARVAFERSLSGVLLGHCAHSKQDIRLAERDRGQHCLVLGQTGAGKTRGVIEAMALQDIARGDSIVHFDFDGDSFDYLHANCPAERRSDIVSLDFTDFDASPGLNLLEYQTRWPKIERSFIVDNLVQILKQQYPANPEAFGPMFEIYMTQAIHLAMDEEGSTVADIVRVFADTAYRRHLLSVCRDARTREFWHGIAAKSSGDSSLESLAPYIICKLTPLVDHELTRRVVDQAKTTIDFRGVDVGRIFLIKLSKGLLSERCARFLGMLLTSRLFAAALSRADMPAHMRRPCYVYLDEFQNLVSPAIEGMLAESRKFGLRLIMSTQNLSQLPGTLAQSVLTNCGTKVLMRVGPNDAALLEPWVKPHFSGADLVALPNRQAIARVLANGMLSPPFAMHTRTMPERDRSPQTDAWVDAIRSESKARYCVDVKTIDARIAARRPAGGARTPLSLQIDK